jgi:hypothetical protein
LRYSSIIDGFYSIKLSREKLALIDAHFLAASHHFFRSESDDLIASHFHQELFWKHITELMKIVMSGDFSGAFDNTHRGLDQKEGWNPDQRFHSCAFGNPQKRAHLFPDEHMFTDMLPDIRYQIHDFHPYDSLLNRPAQQSSAHILLQTGSA